LACFVLFLVRFSPSLGFSKMEETQPPTIQQIFELCDSTYSPEQVAIYLSIYLTIYLYLLPYCVCIFSIIDFVFCLSPQIVLMERAVLGFLDFAAFIPSYFHTVSLCFTICRQLFDDRAQEFAKVCIVRSLFFCFFLLLLSFVLNVGCWLFFVRLWIYFILFF